MSIELGDIVAKLRERGPDGSDLTDRELQILRLVAKGQITKQIAATLGTSEHTVENQRVTIGKKLKAKTPAHMVYIACVRGLI